MNFDSPKPAIITQEGQFIRKCYNQRCASKTAKIHLCNAMLVVIRFITNLTKWRIFALLDVQLRRL